MARRKNTKRIDPRYFLNETTYRDLEEEVSYGYTRGQKGALEAAIFYALRDYNATEQNPAPLSAIFDSQDGAILRYLKEQGLSPAWMTQALQGMGKYTRGPTEIPIPGDESRYVKLMLTTVPVGPSKGEQGMYMVNM